MAAVELLEGVGAAARDVGHEGAFGHAAMARRSRREEVIVAVAEGMSGTVQDVHNVCQRLVQAAILSAWPSPGIAGGSRSSPRASACRSRRCVPGSAATTSWRPSARPAGFASTRRRTSSACARCRRTWHAASGRRRRPGSRSPSRRVTPSSRRSPTTSSTRSSPPPRSSTSRASTRCSTPPSRTGGCGDPRRRPSHARRGWRPLGA